MTVDKKGSHVRISDIVDGFLMVRDYWYYSKREAIKMFKQEQKGN